MTHPLLSRRLDNAIRVATRAHQYQKRKGSDMPYIVHPFAVMTIASRATRDEDVLIACLFHDIIEDVPEQYSREQMVAEFGEQVAVIVDGVTKDDSIASWRERSDAYLAHLNTASIESVIVSAADKIHNLQSILIDHEEIGEKIWERFNAGKEQQVWWYESVLQIVTDRLGDQSPLTHELAQNVDALHALN